MKIRSFTANIAIILIICFSFIHPYTTANSIIVYADDVTNEWTSVTTNQELADAFRYYCKSRNLAIEGSALDAVTTFTTKTFNAICNTLGIDVTALQAHIKKSTDSNGRVQFLFDQTGVTAFNRIFAEFLQNNDLEVGDTADQQNNTVDNGYLFTDDNGHSCYCTVVGNGAPIGAIESSYVVQKGTYFIKDGKDAYTVFKASGATDGNGYCTYFTFRVNNYTYTYTIESSYSSLKYYYSLTGNYIYNGYVYRWNGQENVTTTGSDTGYPSIIYYSQNGNLYTGVCSNSGKAYSKDRITYSNDSLQNVYVFLNTNNTTINNNTYNDNKQTVINNQGDVYNYDYDDNDPPINPGGGGSGGDNTNINIDFPNFDFNIPDIDFSLKGLTEKFPFCIPFDMVALLQLLNAEPQAPRIQGQIPFGSFFTWNLDLDFSRFDDFAVIMRGLEFVGFIFFLIGATINIAKG